MLPVIDKIIRDFQAKLHTSHQDISTYFSDTTAAKPTTTQVPSSQRFQQTFATSFPGEQAPLNSIGLQTSSSAHKLGPVFSYMKRRGRTLKTRMISLLLFLACFSSLCDSTKLLHLLLRALVALVANQR
jgi:hypothetical protein